jgi:predicted phosphodiesterase
VPGFLNSQGCTTLYHLGDICDSNRFDTADDCVDQVKKYGIMAVKGNNDHTLAADAGGGRTNTGIRRETLAFLEDLPLSLTSAGPPWSTRGRSSTRLGLSAMIGTIGPARSR